MIGLAAPWVLALLPLPLLLRRWLPPRTAADGALRVPETIAAAAGAPGRAAHARPLSPGRVLPALVWALLVVALAGPRTGEDGVAVAASGRDLVLAIDLSGSMEREDFVLDGAPAARIDAVKRIAGRFVEGRAGDRVGLVVFGDHAYVAAPLTFDVAAVARAVRGMTIGIAGRSTAISYGLGLALRRLEASDAPGRVIVLLSDGTNTAGNVAPVDAARLAAELGVTIHTIALGPDALSEGADPRNVVDDITLRAIAEAAGGRFFRVRTTDDLAAVSREIDRLETSPTEAPPVRLWRDLWPWPAGLAFGLALWTLAAGTVRRLGRTMAGARGGVRPDRAGTAA